MTSARSASLKKIAWPSSLFRLSVIARLLRWRFWISGPSRRLPVASTNSPDGSILMTWAPQSASWRTAVGPARCAVKSRTRKSFKGSGTVVIGRFSLASCLGWCAPHPPGPWRKTASAVFFCAGESVEYRSYAGGTTNSGKSTSPSTELRERPMHNSTNFPVSERTGIPGDCATLFVSLELSRSTWVATSLAPGGRKMSKHTLAGGNGRDLLDLLARLKTRAEQRIAAPVRVVAIQEVGLDGFWIHRLLEANGVESHVVDPASIAVPRRHRRPKTDAIDGETLLRTLIAWQRGEPRVCAMTVPPSPSEEDCRRVSRERATLLRERIQHTNRIRGLLFGQGITNYNPLHKNRRECLEELRTGD